MKLRLWEQRQSYLIKRTKSKRNSLKRKMNKNDSPYVFCLNYLFFYFQFKIFPYYIKSF